jgi:predicted MFS family arabinose efflux permease
VQHQLDYPGALLLTTGTVCLLLLLTWGGTTYPWLGAVCLSLAACSLATLGAFLWQESRAAEPLLPLKLFRSRVFVVAVLVTALTAMALFGAFVFLPTYYQLVRGLSSSASGLLTAPLMGGLIVASVIGGRIVSATGRYKLFPVIGLAVAAGALAVAAGIIRWGASLGLLEATLVVLGGGLGLVMPNLTVAIQNAVARSDLGIATSANAFMRSLGGSLGVAVSGAMMATGLAGVPVGSRLGALAGASPGAVAPAFQQAFSGTFLAGAALVVVAFGTVLFLPEKPLRGAEGQ